jgi:hypothetical protein
MSIMSNAAMVMGRETAVTRAELGWKFIRWGLSLFILGFIIGFVPILHYMVGGQAGNVEPLFLKNMTLWWGCPAVLSELTVKAGSLGMVAIGLSYLAADRQGGTTAISSHERVAPMLCAFSLIAMFVYAAVGYAAGVAIFGNFYFGATDPGKNLWLGGQGVCVVIYVFGLFYAVAGVRRAAPQPR